MHQYVDPPTFWAPAGDQLDNDSVAESALRATGDVNEILAAGSG
jgi:hypothetical protein